jgi:hypothetical protein
MAQLNFNANTVAPSVAMEILPAGWYTAKVADSVMKPTKDATGSYLEITFVVMSGPALNRKLFARFNLNNANKTAVEIAQRDLAAICHATGVMQLSDSAQLHGKVIAIKVKVIPASGQYEAKNDVGGYKAVEAGTVVGAPTTAPAWVAAPAVAPVSPAHVAAPAVASDVPPWAQ